MKKFKKILIQNVLEHLNSSRYFFIINFYKVSSKNLLILKKNLSKSKSKIFFIKKRLFLISFFKWSKKNLDKSFGKGPISIIFGNKKFSEVSKSISKFFRLKNYKIEKRFRLGFLDKCEITFDQFIILSKINIRFIREVFLLTIINKLRNVILVINNSASLLIKILKKKSKK
jgi:ribosomal protein L10